tara:strand:+ start:903 stop:1481 length:579 start_codon:yes stop_codon:yes gene_type:complete
MYFKSFPTTNWNGQEMVDLSRRADILTKIQGDPTVFLPYTLKENDTMESVAYYYYGDAGLSWLVGMANDIIDPYTDFWKPFPVLERFIAEKYAEECKASLNLSYTPEDIQVIEWTKNATILDNIVYYVSLLNDDLKISRKTQEGGKYASSEFVAQRYYDYEIDENEKKRNIQVISNEYVAQIIDEMKTILND